MSAEGPKLPETAQERTVWRDQMLEAGFTPPWPLKEKPTTIKGSELAKRTSALMSRLAAGNAVLATLDEQRISAEAEVAAAEAELEAMGIASLSDISRIEGRRDYPVCAEPTCQVVTTHYWMSEPGWRCYLHARPPPKPEAVPADSPAAVEKPEVMF